MSKIDRVINIYQTYSVAKISALSKQTLIAQHAQCEQITKLERTLQKELRSLQRVNQNILENQIKEAKKSENIKYYRLIAHNCRQAIYIIQEQSDPIIKLFCLELFQEPFSMFLQEAKNNLEEISDLDYCAESINLLHSIRESVSDSQNDYTSSPFHTMLLENQPYLNELSQYEEAKAEKEKEINALPQPELKPIISESQYKSSCFLKGSKALVIFGIFMFMVNILAGEEIETKDSIIDTAIGFLVIPITLYALLQYFANKKGRGYNVYVDNIRQENNAIQAEYDNRIKLLRNQLDEIDKEITECNQCHQYVVAKTKASNYFSDWEALINKLQSFLPAIQDKSEKPSNTSNAVDEELLCAVKQYLPKIGLDNPIGVTMLQRRFSLGFNTAGRVIDTLLKQGYIQKVPPHSYKIIKLD